VLRRRKTRVLGPGIPPSIRLGSGLYTKPLKKGYNLDYFGQLKQRGMAIYVWKVSVPGEQEDVLVSLALKDGKVAGVTAH